MNAVRIRGRRSRSWIVLLGSALVLSLAGVFARSAAADPPVITRNVTESFTSRLSGVCSFDVAVSSTNTAFLIFYSDASGTTTRIFAHVVEQDTFSANGITIAGLPYTWDGHATLDASGNFIVHTNTGAVEKIVLPDGTLFLSVGIVFVLSHPDDSFFLTPDRGHSGDIAAFCAALS
jgi:hypothetical protein